MRADHSFTHTSSLFKTIPRWPEWLLLTFVACTTFVPARSASSAAIDEGQIRAAVLSHIFTLTQWPAPGISAGTLPNTVILGRDPGGLAAILSERMKGAKATEDHITQIIDLNPHTPSDKLATTLQTCQALYLTRDGMQYLPQLLPLLSRYPILTIGETEDFCRNGNGMICLTIENQKLVIQIHRQLAFVRGFTFGAELLRHAVLVDGVRP